MSARGVLQRLSPPILLEAARWMRGRATGSRQSRPVWELVPEGWSKGESDPNVKGWDVAAIRDWHVQRFEFWSRAFEEPNALGASEYATDPTEQHLHTHNVHVSFAYVLALAASRRASISVLDWGGGIGQYYFLARATQRDVELSYHCKDLPLLCEAGRRLVPQVSFSDDESCLARQYDLVFASNSLQYSEDWRGMLAKLARSAANYLYVAQLPTVRRTASFVAVQRPYAHGYDTEYLGWILNFDDVVDALSALDLQLVREFFFGHRLDVSGVAEAAFHRGFLLRRPSAPDTSS